MENKIIRSNKFQIKSDLVLRRYYEVDVIRGIKKLGSFFKKIFNKKIRFIFLSAQTFTREMVWRCHFYCFFVNFIQHQIHHLKGIIQCFLVYLQCHTDITAILFLSPQKETPSPLAVTPKSCLSPSPNLLSVSVDLSVLSSSSEWMMSQVAFGAWQKVLRVDPRRGPYQHFPPTYRPALLLSVAVPPCVYPRSSQWPFG